MRNVIASAYLTLDGRAGDLQEWVTAHDSDAMAGYHSDLLANSDGLLLGRKTYETFAFIWPPRAGTLGYADVINKMAKYVASRTLTDLTWENSHLIEGDVVSGVAKLKEQPGGDLIVYGGPSLVSTLQQHGLIDEYRLLVHPVVLGKSTRLFQDGGPRVDLDLVGADVVSPNVAVLTYRPVR